MTSETSWTSADVTASGTSGGVSTVVGSDTLSCESAYDIRITVTDGGGSSNATTYLSSMQLAFDALRGGKGIAFGKTAEEEGVADCAFLFRTFHGELLTSPLELAENTDLDDVTTAGHYVIGSTTVSTTILNKPLWYADATSTAYIVVERAGDGAQVIQRYYPCVKAEQFEISRTRYSGTWGDWMITKGCTAWNTLTIASGFETYETGTNPKYRVNGNLVTITGVLKPTSTVTSSATGVKLASGIKTQYCPEVTLIFVCQGSGINRWILTVDSSGAIYVSRYGTNDYVDIPTGAWLPFCVTYSI